MNAANLAAANTDMSLVGLFLHAGIVVQVVAVLLVLASVWVWAIVFEKLTTLRRVNRQAHDFEERFWSGGSLDEMYAAEGLAPTHPMAVVFSAAMTEWRKSAQVVGADYARGSVADRIERSIGVSVGREMERLERWMTFLATVGSTATFVGLFGTVWGIMNSFQSIAQSNNTSLSVVAPGIAEALFATALGLVAAVPAVVAYNKISTDLSRFAARLEAFGSEFSSILSRQIEERA